MVTLSLLCLACPAGAAEIDRTIADDLDPRGEEMA
jgi:hypothetical protein